MNAFRVPRARLASAVAATALFARTARGEDLSSMVSRVERAWTKDAAIVRVLPARFLFDDEITTVAIPAGPPDRPCLTVAAVASRGVSTELWFGPRERAADQGLSRASAAGLVELRVPCGMAARSVSLASHAGRGAVEIVAAWHRGPLTPVTEVLSERASGDVPAPLDVGPSPWPAPLAKRVVVFEAQTAARGFVVAPQRTIKTEAGSATRVRVPVEPGCHVIRLFTEVGHHGRRAFVDLDADLVDAEGGVVARDRSDAIDATLEACVAAAQVLDVIIGATSADADVVLSSAHVGIPRNVPTAYGDEAASRMTRAFVLRHLKPPGAPAVALALGGAQVTRFAQNVVPGACYAAVVATLLGAPRRLRLQVSVGANEHLDEHGRGEPYALVSFCTSREAAVTVEVEARGRDASWGFALFRLDHATK